MTNKKYFLIGLIIPLIIAGLGTQMLYTHYKTVEQKEKQIFIDGYEKGRYDELNETIRNNIFDELQESVKAEVQEKKQSSKNSVLKQLAQIESGNGKKRKVLDTNGKYSLGLYHFQASTVKDMYRRYYNKNITVQEAVTIAENDELATKLAYDAIFLKEEKYHWKISMCKIGVLTKGCLTQKQINHLFAKK